MKKIYNLLIIAALLAVSCEKSVVESPTVETEPEQEIVYPEIQVALSVDTKTTITDNGSTFSFAFQEDDDIAVFNGVKDEDTHLPCRYRCTRIEGGVAYFSYYPTTDAESAIRPDPELATIVATHPYRGTTTSGYETYGSGTLKVRMANSLSSSSSGYVKASVPIVAAAAAGDVLQFKHTIGLMQLKLKGTDINIKQIVVVSDKQIVGDSGLEYGDSEPVLEVKGTDGNGSISDFYKATYKYNDATGLPLSSEGMDFYIALPEGSHNLSLTITDADGNSMLLSAPSVPISRGVVIPTELNYVADPLSNVTNLSAFGHVANCYVVTDAGNYCFNARKPDGTLVSGSSAAWVWASSSVFSSAATEEVMNENLIDNISLSNGKIYFSTPKAMTTSNCGNVVVAVLDDSKNIQYTWHIWLTPAITDITAAEITVMDRNLGAGAAGYTNQNSRGNFYQWGRKDPILGGYDPSFNNAGSEATAFTAPVSQYHIINTAAGITDLPTSWQAAPSSSFGTTVEAGAQNPLTMAKSKAVPGYDSSDSTTPWCDRQSGNSNPCPYGYRVLSSEQFASLVTAGVSRANTGDLGKYVLAGSVNFPRAGFRRGASGLYTNSALNSSAGSNVCYGSYFTDTPYNAANGCCYNFQWSWDSDSSTYKNGSASASNSDAYNARSVRCVKVDDI